MPLPVPEDTIRVRMRATLGTGAAPAEEAQFGFWGVRRHFTGNVTSWQADMNELAGKIRDAWVDQSGLNSLFSSAVRMESVTCDHLEASTGKTLEQGAASFTGDNVWVGAATNSLPWETTVAVSLYGYEQGEFTQNKPRKRGRFYLPPMSVTVIGGPTGQVGGGDLDQLNIGIGGFLNTVQGAEIGSGPNANSDYFDLRVISRGTPEKPLPPTSTQIIRMSIDSKVDSQRRRERQQPASLAVSTAIEHAD